MMEHSIFDYVDQMPGWLAASWLRTFSYILNLPEVS